MSIFNIKEFLAFFPRISSFEVMYFNNLIKLAIFILFNLSFIDLLLEKASGEFKLFKPRKWSLEKEFYLLIQRRIYL